MTARIKDRRFVWDGGEADLDPFEWSLLTAIMQRKGHILTWEDMMFILWPDDDDIPETAYSRITQAIYSIRIKLKGSGLNIKTGYGRGYRLEVE